MTDKELDVNLDKLADAIEQEQTPLAAKPPAVQQAAPSPLSAERQHSVMATIAQIHRTEQELADTQTALAAVKVDLRGAMAQNEEMRREIDIAHDRMEAALAARDHAIAERAVLEALFSLVRSTLDQAELPAALLDVQRSGEKLTLSVAVGKNGGTEPPPLTGGVVDQAT